MIQGPSSVGWIESLNGLAGGLFLLTAFGLVGLRQVYGCLRLFVIQSLLLATSALLLASLDHTWHLVVVGVVDIATKVIAVPWIFRRALHDEVQTRREINQVLNIPTALLLALALALVAYLISAPLVRVGGGPAVEVNLPVGLAGLLIGGLTAALRREAVPLFLGLLAMENSAFLAGIAVAPEFPLLAEVAIAFDVLILVLVVNVLTRAVHERIGTTEVGALRTLTEGVSP
jgi:hydrogenase-4 component E